MNGKVKLWMGVGAWVLASTSTVALTVAVAPPRPASAQETGAGGEGGEAGTPAKTHNHAAAAGGEGGEGGEAGGPDPLASRPPDVAFASRLLLIRGHLRVGRELFQADHPKDAMPHFMHPAEEIYGDLKGELKTRKIAPFRNKLHDLSEVVEHNQKAKFDAAYDAALKAVDAAYAAIAPATRQQPGFAAATIATLLEVAADEYKEAITDGRVSSPVEYQDSRGFVAEATALFEQAKPGLVAKSADSAARVEAIIAELQPVWPSAVPPEKAVKQPGDIAALSSRMSLLAGDFN